MINEKIHLIGSTGSGKSYIGNILSQKYDIPHFDLDDIFWSINATHFGANENPEERDRKLKDISVDSKFLNVK